jgi:quinol monooxygenase YgiN
MADHYASGTWQVKQGCDQEFIDRWTEFLQWSRANYPSIVVANLIRDRRVPGHYVSFAEWTEEASRDAWKQNPEFTTHFDACFALCEHMSGADFDRVATV